MMKALTIIAVLFLVGCSEYKLDTFAKWCERIIDEKSDEKHQPFWAVFPGVSFHHDAVRDDFVNFLNNTYMEKVKNSAKVDRSPRMAWREGTNLHLVDPSSYFGADPEKLIVEWRRGIERANTNKLEDKADKCLYETITGLFDSMHIHSRTGDIFGKDWTDDVTVIDTDRKARFAKYKLAPP
jgi:hypothetical protein